MRVFSALVAVAASVLIGHAVSAQTVFCQWDFDAVGPVGPVDDNTGLPTDAPYYTSGLIYNTPTPTIGNGFCIPLGMENLDSGPPNHTGTYVFGPYGGLFVYGTVPFCDVSGQSGLAHGGQTYALTCWRVRGPNNTFVAPGVNNGNGWNRAAPERSQGAQFSTSTVGYTGIQFHCQISCSTQSVSRAQAQYTTDGSTWIDFGAPINMASNDFIQPPSGLISNTNFGVNLDFSSTSGVNNNPNFGVRIVSVYDTRYTGAGAPTYAAAANPTTTAYNNSSGNWRFALMTFTGTPTGAINPVIRASTDRIAACGSESNTIKFQAFIQPGVNPPSTGTTVFADLSSVGLSNHQQLTGNPSGTFFTYTGTIPANTVMVPAGQTTPINRTVNFTVSDDQGRSVTTGSSISFVNCNAADAGSTVVISQVYGGGGNTDSLNANNQGVYDSDFVEIYNRSANPVNLNGWSVQYASPASSGGFNNTNNQVNLSGTIQPQQYMLIRFSDPVHGFLPLPAPDFSTRYGYGGIGNNGGRVVLSNSTALVGTAYTAANVKDLVGFGAAAVTFEGAGPAPTPDNAHSVIRASTATDPHPGAQDSNQSFHDFVLGPPAPHNRASNGTATFLTAYASIPASDPDNVVVTNSACAGSTVLFTVAVTPGSSSTNIAVTGDVSTITGVPGAVTLFDDGPAGGHGDAVLGDGIYSLAYPIPSGAAQGFRTVNFTATDAQSGSASSSLVLAVGSCVDSGAPVVISKLFGGGAHYTYVPNMDFAEIFNRSNAPVDMTGWNVQYQDSDNDFSAAKSIPLSGVIGPGERRLIAPQPVAGIGLPIPAPDFSAALPGFGFDNHFGRFALVKPIAPATTAATLVATGAGSGVIDSRGLVDLVGYGSTDPTYEGIAPTDTLSNGTWLTRKNNGAQDFNQNLIDFDVAFILSFPQSTRSLSVSRVTAATSTGSVTSDLGGINCGAICSGIFDRGTAVTLTATPGPHSKFVGWSGACTGAGPCQVTLDDSASVTATFGCIADFNNANGVTVQDIFDFLAAWFAGTPSADFNGVDGLNVQDIFDFLSAWFAGC